MSEPRKPELEAPRLEELCSLGILDTPVEERFERITRTARRLFRAPIALISLVDADRQWFKSKQGIDATQTPRNISFCGHAILSDETFVVEDALLDPRFADNPLVVSLPRIRFYAGSPLHGPRGFRLGTLCVIDTSPRTFDADDRASLADLATWASSELQSAKLSEGLRTLDAQEVRLQAILDNVIDGIVVFDTGGRIKSVNAAAERMFGYNAAEIVSNNMTVIVPASSEIPRMRAIKGVRSVVDSRVVGAARTLSGFRKDGTTFPVELSVGECNVEAEVVLIGIIRDVTGRVRAEVEVARARAHLEAFVQYAPAAIAILDLSLCYIAHSDRWLLENRLPPGSLVGADALGLFVGTQRAWFKRFQRSLAGETVCVPNEVQHMPDGSERLLRRETRPWRYVDGAIGGIVMVIEDVTDRERNASELRARDELLKKLSQRVPGMIFRIRQCPEGVASAPYVSDGISDVLELQPADVATSIAVMIGRVRCEDRAGLLESLDDSKRELKLWSREFRAELPKRGSRWLHAEGLPELAADGATVWHGYLADITERRRAEEELEALSGRLSLATRAGGLGVWDWDLRSGGSIWDARAAAIYRIEPGKDSSPADAMLRNASADDVLRVSQTWRRAVESEGTFDMEYRIQGGDRLQYDVRCAGIVSYDRAIAVRVTGIIADVSAMRKVEKLKSELISTVSHELRTPLTSIHGALGLIIEEELGNARPRLIKLVNIAQRNSERLTLLVNDFLDMEKIDYGKMTLCCTIQKIMPLVDAAIEDNAGYAAVFNVHFALTQALPDAAVSVDAGRFMQVMANLLSNAAKYSPSGKSVNITVSRHGKHVRVGVRDYGPGISPEFVPRVFDKFSQEDSSDTRSKGGTGLGLTISRALAEQMQGTLFFETEVGHGTEFIFEVPLMNAEVAC